MFGAEDNGDEATVYLYDVIVSDDYWGGVSTLSFAKQLASITAPTINLRINSPGGDVFAARAMETAIREHKSNIISHIDGQAASAATYVAIAADTVKMSEGGFFMIHKAWSIAWGNADDMLQMAALLEKVDESLVATYANHTGKDAGEIREWMAAETWFGAQEALDAGFVDEIVTVPVKNQQRWDLSAYAHAPKIAQENEIKMKHQTEMQHMKRMAALARHLP
ncbi:MAG: Clp protease ClpP [Nitrosomonas sp.]|nr:Clp protease ClpP [Nitrosomonas sp.]